MYNTRIALYIGNSLYPTSTNDPANTVSILQNSPLTSPILSLLNQSANNPDLLVYNDGTNPVFNNQGDYVGNSDWAKVIASLRSGGNIEELYLSFSTNGTTYMSDLITQNSTAAQKILSYIKNDLGFDGIDLDYEDNSNLGPGSPIYVLADAAIQAGLKLTSAPYAMKSDWAAWVQYVQGNGGTISWLNLQCYAGGKSINPGDWLDIGVPIVAGTCKSCGGPQTTCSVDDVERLFTLWTTGKGSVSTACWWGTPNTSPQAIGGGFIWAYSSIQNVFLPYMNAMKTGLGL